MVSRSVKLEPLNIFISYNEFSKSVFNFLQQFYYFVQFDDQNLNINEI